MITISLEKDTAFMLLNYFGVQNINDVKHIVEEHSLKSDAKNYDNAIQSLFEQIFKGLEEDY